MILRLRRRRRRASEQTDRIQAAREAAVGAQAEATRSQARFASVHKHYVTPLRAAGDRNHFAELIRSSLAEGYGEGARH